MGKLTNLNPAAPIADANIPASITRDTETTEAINAHANATDPHAQYMLQSEVDAALALKAPLGPNGKLALPLDKMPTGNAWGQELPHSSLQDYTWDATPFGTFFSQTFAGGNNIPPGQYFGCKWALGSDIDFSNYFFQIFIGRFSHEIYFQWVENGVIVKESKVVQTILF